MADNKESVGKTLLVAFLVCVVCGVVVATAAVTLRPVQNENKLLDKRINILQAADLYKPGMDVNEEFKTVERRFVDLDTGEYKQPANPDSYDQRKAANNPDKSVNLSGDEDQADIKRQAKIAEVYLSYNEQGDLNRIILPVHGYGLWSTMYGFLALEPDANTIAGFGFYEHGETPGLGGEVDNPKWKAQWPGKELFDDKGNVAIKVVKNGNGNPKSDHVVDGLAGATLTTNGVNNLVRFWIGKNGFGPYLDRMRSGETKKTAAAPADKQEGEA